MHAISAHEARVASTSNRGNPIMDPPDDTAREPAEGRRIVDGLVSVTQQAWRMPVDELGGASLAV
jgi:hypothetical protein